MLLAWTEVWNTIFAGWEVQTIWNLQKNVYGEACFSQKKFLQEG